MEFHKTTLDGAYLIEPERNGDERGFFARMFCTDEFAELGLDSAVCQMNDSYSKIKGTLRGMHYQLAPHAETKMVRCIRGAIFDVILDLRQGSPTLGQWFGAELNQENRQMMYVPKGFAHGMLTLMEDTEVIYIVTEKYAPQHERGVRWNDPAFSIEWPLEPVLISPKDAAHPDFDADYHLGPAE